MGQDPLFMTTSGRPSTATIRRDCYKMSRECVFSGDCPHDREISNCEAADQGVPTELLSDRVDVSVPVLDKHYDQRSEERKSQRRREALEAAMEGYAYSDGGQELDDE